MQLNQKKHRIRQQTPLLRTRKIMYLLWLAFQVTLKNSGTLFVLGKPSFKKIATKN